MKTYKLIPAMLLSLLLSLGLLSGCDNNDPLDDLGENAEELGDSLQESANDAQREIEDATD